MQLFQSFRIIARLMPFLIQLYIQRDFQSGPEGGLLELSASGMGILLYKKDCTHLAHSKPQHEVPRRFETGHKSICCCHSLHTLAIVLERVGADSIQGLDNLVCHCERILAGSDQQTKYGFPEIRNVVVSLNLIRPCPFNSIFNCRLWNEVSNCRQLMLDIWCQARSQVTE